MLGTGIHAEELLMTMQKLGWEVKGKALKKRLIWTLFRGLRQPSRDRSEQCRECDRTREEKER